MLRPSLAVARRSEKSVDYFDVGVGRRIGEKRGLLGWSGRQAGEVEGHAAQERAFIGARIGLELGGGELGENEVVDRVLEPVFVLVVFKVIDAGHFGPGERSKRPIALFERLLSRRIGRFASWGRGVGRWRNGSFVGASLLRRH